MKLPGNFEIIVVDGGSSDETLAGIQNYENVKLFASDQGRAVQMNYGAKKAEGDILLFLHADTLLPYKTFTLITKQLQKKKL